MGRIKVLMLNGTSWAAVEALTVLDPKQYEIHVCDSNPGCWCRLHHHCAHFFKSPHLGSNPKAFFEFILRRLQSESYDVILPIHEEGLLLAKYQNVFRKYTHLLIGDASAFHTIMNKRLCLERAQSLGIPTPQMKIAHTLDEVAQLGDFPCYVKLPYGTSSSGVRRIASPQDCAAQLRSFADSPEFIIQKEIVGDLFVIQLVFVGGKMIAAHQYRALAKGFGGGASHRLSVHCDDLREYATLLGADLHWSGPVMLDFIRERETGTSYLIEGNPRIGETFNATLAGLNIADLMINLSLGKPSVALSRSRPGLRSHQMFTEVTAAIARDETLIRKWVIAFSSLAGWGRYKSSREELIHPSIDPVSLYKTAVIVLGMPFLTKRLIAAHNSATIKNMVTGANATATILKSHWDRVMEHQVS